MCGLDCLQKAVTSVFEKNLNKTNVFKVLEILKKNQVSSEEVRNFVVNNFDKKELLQNDLLEKFPEIAVSMVKKDEAMKDIVNIFVLETTTLRGPNTGPIVQIGPNTSINECLQFSFNKSWMIYGIGLTLLPGTTVNVKVSIDKIPDFRHARDFSRQSGMFGNLKCDLAEEDVKVSVPMSSVPKVYAVPFSKPVLVPYHVSSEAYQMQLSIKVKGNGSARVFPKNIKFHWGQIFDQSVNGEDFAMSVSSPKKKPPTIIAEIYCKYAQTTLPDLS